MQLNAEDPMPRVFCVNGVELHPEIAEFMPPNTHYLKEAIINAHQPFSPRVQTVNLMSPLA
jgi:hypothetical protein